MPAAPDISAQLKLHPDVQTLDDEWSGITDPVLRRKLQNRLNQRAARRRKAARQSSARDQDKDAASENPAVARIDKSTDLQSLIASKIKTSNQWLESYHAAGHSDTSIRSAESWQRWYQVLLRSRICEITTLMERLQQQRDTAWLYPLPADHLISLVYYNVYRALIANAAMLGLDPNLMYSDDYPSPFLPLSPSATSALRRLPPSLQPTKLQCTVAHHPEWDILPDPVVRDNILRYGEENIDDMEICFDMVGDGTCCDVDDVDTQRKNGAIVWGEPWDPSGWEVTEAFAQKWAWILKGAFALQNSTNMWRARRGQEPIDFSRITEVE